MAFKTFAPGVLTSSDVNTFLMRQAVITCTSSTRPASPSEGMTIYETDTDLILTYSGTAWQVVSSVGTSTYTPTLSGSGWSFGSSTVSGRFTRYGLAVFVQVNITWASGVSQGSGALSVSLPLTSSTALGGPATVAVGYVIDSSLARAYPIYVARNSPTTVSIQGLSHSADADTVTLAAWNSTSAAGGLDIPTDSGDTLSFSIHYEAA